jgi:hypothetical protein
VEEWLGEIERATAHPDEPLIRGQVVSSLAAFAIQRAVPGV